MTTLQPQVGVSVLVKKDNKFLFGKRLSEPGANTWQIPGGKLDMYESWKDCAIREVREETTLEIENIKYLTCYNRPWPDHQKHYTVIVMTADWKSGIPTVPEEEKSKCELWDWFWPHPTPLMERSKIFESQEFINYLLYQDNENDFSLVKLNAPQLIDEVIKLRNGIRMFLTKEGQDWCWENYNELGKLLPEKLVPQPPKVCSLDAMEGCVKYWKMLQSAQSEIPEPIEKPPEVILSEKKLF